MSEPSPERVHAGVRHGWWPGWIWAIPIAALLVVIWLGARALLAGGTDITVRFNDAHEMKTEHTDVILRGAQVGHVTSVKLNDDGTAVIVTASIDEAAAKFLTRGTRFWLQGANPSLNNLSSLGSLLSGPTIVMEPGTGPKYAVRLGILPGAQPAALPVTAEDGLPQIPVAEGSAIATIVNRINKVPIEQISHNLLDITSHVSALTSSPRLKDAVAQLDAALRQIHGMTAKAAPQVPVVIARLRRAGDLDGTAKSADRLMSGTATQNGLSNTVEEITQTARAARSLADYLDRHPEALIRGRRGATQ